MDNLTIIETLSGISPFNDSLAENMLHKLKENLNIHPFDNDHLHIREKLSGLSVFADAQSEINFFCSDLLY